MIFEIEGSEMEDLEAIRFITGVVGKLFSIESDLDVGGFDTEEATDEEDDTSDGTDKPEDEWSRHIFFDLISDSFGVIGNGIEFFLDEGGVTGVLCKGVATVDVIECKDVGEVESMSSIILVDRRNLVDFIIKS